MPSVCLTFDFDAVSPWIHVDGGARNTPTNRSRGVFGAEVGTPRLLDLLAEREVPATWFVPGHTIESFPDPCRRIAAEGHELAHHGWSHTPPGDYESRAAERDDIERGMGAIENLTGDPPAGYRSPSWDYSEHTVDLLVELGFEYSSSGMARDFRPYYARRDGAPADGPYERGERTELVEVPVSWHRDDYPWLAFSADRSRRNVADVFDEWRATLDWLCEADGERHDGDGPSEGEAVFVLTLHPQVSGRAPTVRRLGEFVDFARDRGATFRTVREVAASFAE